MQDGSGPVALRDTAKDCGGTVIKPPFTLETALQKVQDGRGRVERARPGAGGARGLARLRVAESRGVPARARGNQSIPARKWAKELDYGLKETLWGFRENRILVSFEYEWHDEAGQWYRSYGNELWEFDEEGL